MDRALWKLLILLQVAGLTLSSREYIPDNEAIFTECFNPPPGSKSFDGLLDTSKFISKRGKDGLHISGNLSSSWDVDPNDRVEVNFALLKKDRDNWKPTAIAASVKDFCKEMYDKNTLYYPYSMIHIANWKDTKDKCLNHKGTLLLLEPFVVKAVLGPVPPLTPGAYKVVVMITSVNKAGVPNPNSICFEIPGKIV